MRWLCIVGLLGTCFAGTILHAAEAASRPTTMPATQPVKVDLSTPVAAYRTFIMAWREGDVAAYLACIDYTTPEDRKLVKGWAEFMIASTRLRLDIERQFGPDVAKEIMEASPMDTPHAIALDSWPGRVKVNGDEAQISADFGSRETVRINGQWKVRTTPKEQLVDDKNDWPLIYGLITQAHEQLAEQLEQGSIKTVEELKKASSKVFQQDHTRAPAPAKR